MMTAEERQARQLVDTLALREKIVKTYGVESPLVAQMDVAIGRLTDQMNGLTDAQKQFFDNLSQGVATAITEWQGWGDFARKMLAGLVNDYGADFFMSLLNPGKGTGLGGIVGNSLTAGIKELLGGGGGGKVDVGRLAAARVANVTAMADLDMTPFHKVMAARSSAEALTIVQHNDFRGADQSIIPQLKAELAKRDRELPGKVIAAVREARRRRVDL